MQALHDARQMTQAQTWAHRLAPELIAAANRGDVDAMQRLIGLDRSVVKAPLDGPGRTALMHASLAGSANVVRLLIQNGADLNASTTTGSTAVWFAATNGKIACLKALLRQGGDPNVQAKVGQKFKSVLTVAQEKRRSDCVACLEFWLRRYWIRKAKILIDEYTRLAYTNQGDRPAYLSQRPGVRHENMPVVELHSTTPLAERFGGGGAAASSSSAAAASSSRRGGGKRGGGKKRAKEGSSLDERRPNKEKGMMKELKGDDDDADNDAEGKGWYDGQQGGGRGVGGGSSFKAEEVLQEQQRPKKKRSKQMKQLRREDADEDDEWYDEGRGGGLVILPLEEEAAVLDLILKKFSEEIFTEFIQLFK